MLKVIKAAALESLENKLFATKIIDSPIFSADFHFHKECQLVYVAASCGKRIIGDSIEHFESDELIFLGPSVPHVWFNEQSHFGETENQSRAKSVALFFDFSKIITLLRDFGDFRKLEDTVDKARRGMKFCGQTKFILQKKLKKIVQEDDEFSKMILFITILKLLSTTNEYELLSSAGYVNNYQLKDNDRIFKVLKYVYANFSKEITLETAANMTGMNKESFCRYFKSRTKKTFIGFVNEVKIGQACKYIANEDIQMALVCEKCGFNSISNFNKFFKQVKGITPKEYKKQYRIPQGF